MATRLTTTIAAIGVAATPIAVSAQRANENAVATASDGFGATVGNERVGVYTTNSVRGFSPITAGNRRLDGLYFDFGGNGLTNRLYTRTTVRVGLPALAYPFPAPSGIVDYALRVSGDEAVLSVVAGRPAYGGYSVELDGQTQLGDTPLAFGAGLGAARNRYADGRTTEVQSAAIIPTLRLGDSEWTGFFGYAESGGDVPAVLITRGGRLPPAFDSRRFANQPWIDNDQRSWTYGITGRLGLSEGLDLRLVALESRSVRHRTYADLYLDVQPDGTAQNIVVSDPRLPARWTSGEARLSWTFDAGGAAQTLHAIVRGRDKALATGGSAQAVVGPVRLGVMTPVDEPLFTYGASSLNAVRQGSAGLAYIGRWRALEMNLGVQKTDYRSELRRPASTDRTDAQPWLYNAMLALVPTDWLGLYAGVSRGLEESSPAPASAVNRDEAVPASRTRQFDAGVRLALGPMRLVGGVFELERPYYSVGADNRYQPLGEIRNRGAEFSLAGAATDRLNVVAGLVLMDPRVVGPAFDDGRAGRRPVNTTTRSARLDMEYSTPVVEGLSFTLGLQHTGPLVASTAGYAELGDRQLKVAASTITDLGARYRFELADTPMTLRVQLLNLFDVRRHIVSSSNAFAPPDRRRLTVQLAADF